MNTATPLSTEGKTEEIQTGTKSKKGSSVLDFCTFLCGACGVEIQLAATWLANNIFGLIFVAVQGSLHVLGERNEASF